MKLYTCGNCNNLIYFENNICLNCKYPVGFDADVLSMITLVAENNQQFANIQQKDQKYRFCQNAGYSACNWLIPATQESVFCKACELNRIIPALDDENLKRWRNVEVAKHRLIYSLLRLKLPVQKKIGTEEAGIAFDFLADMPATGEKVMTGHDNGTITLNIDEADEAERVRHKTDLGERYRTLLGHFRHEIGHYYWEVLIRNTDNIARYRELFGNEEKDYAEALEIHYKNGAPANWSESFISPYATSHSWEDWAETWAHYLHLMDTMETASSFGIRIQPEVELDVKSLQASIKQDPYEVKDFTKIFKWWLPLTFAVNSLSRGMGYSDFYPFVISDPVVQKLKFIHELCFNLEAGGIRKEA